MTMSQKAKLFGRLSEDQQRETVHKAHQIADSRQRTIGIFMCAEPVEFVFAFTDIPLFLGEPWHLVRTVKPRPVQNADIRSVMQADTRRRSAPWEGRGNHD